MRKISKNLKIIYDRLHVSRGFSPERLILTSVYLGVALYTAMLFSESRKKYVLQFVTLIVFILSVWLLVRSLKKIFDHKTRTLISRALSRIRNKISEKIGKITEKIVKALGLDRFRNWGDERDFIFRERRKGKKRHKLVNPMYWEEQEDNASRVRYIFTDYMIGKIRSGYTVKPSKTPLDMDRDLSASDAEHLLFDSYTAARYSGGREKITDTDIETLEELQYGKKKKRVFKNFDGFHKQFDGEL